MGGGDRGKRGGGEEGMRKVGWLGNIHTVQCTCVDIGMTEIDIQPLTC